MSELGFHFICYFDKHSPYKCELFISKH